MKQVYKIAGLAILIVLFIGIAQPTGQLQAQSIGFRVVGRNLVDSTGNNFIMRGVAHPHVWFPSQTAAAIPAIKAAGANTVRVVLSGGRWTPVNDAADVASVINLCKTNRLICVLEDHDTTGFGEDGAATSLATAVNYWRSIQSALTGQEAYVIINIGNEPYGNNNASAWVADTRNAIIAMRNAGFRHTLLVDAPNWGQDWQFNMRDNAASIFNADPDRNTVFAIHMYGVFDTAAEIQSYVSTFVNAGLPLVIGEFGWNHSDGNPDEDAIMATAQSNGVGYIAWSWSGNGGGVEYLDMVTNFNPNQRSDWGNRVITGANGFSTTSREACVFGGCGPTATPTRTPTACVNCPTHTPTRTPSPTSTQPPGNLRVQLMSSGTDNNQQSQFRFRLQNPGASAQSNISVRIYFTLDGSQAASSYVLEKYWDQSGVATVSAPTQASGSTYYFTVNYGTASLAAGGSWEFHTNLRLSNWSNNLNAANDWWHTTGTLPASYTDWPTVPAYVGTSRVWGNEPSPDGVTNTPTRTSTGVTPSSTPTRTSTGVTPSNTPTRTSTGVTPTMTPTRTPSPTTCCLTNTPTSTPTPTATTSTPPPGNLRVQLQSGGTDNNQQSQFRFRVQNTGAAVQSNISTRIYFTLDGSQAASTYVLEKYYDQSGVATLSGPTQASGSTYYFTVNFGPASLGAGSAWEFHTSLHLNNWGSTFSGSNDWWHTPGVLPTAYTDWPSIPAYVSGMLVWGSEPGGGPTHTPTVTPTGMTPTSTPTRTPTPTTCCITGTPTGTSTPTTTPVGPTSTPTRTATNPPQGTHLENPFVGANFYRNVDYTASVNAAADQVGGTLGARMRQVAGFPTFVWMDSIDAVNGTNGYPRSLEGHLDAALAQGANAIGIVVYDLPNRDCSALASNGELLIANNGLNIYRTQYIDPIFAAINQPRFANLRVVMVIEPDSLPNLITNLSFAKCAEAQSTGAYVQGTQYAIGTLRSIPNTYAYIDVGHHGWLGWPSNFNPFVDLLKSVGAGIPGGIGRIDGFIGNTANTGPTVEPFMTANQMINGQPVRSVQGWYDWNDYIDEQSYLTALRNALISGSNPFPSSIGMLIDTSRNGWGGPNRPTGPSTSTDLVTFVMATRIDKRIHKGNWCNQDGAGIGARPTAAPAAGFDAWVWVKPPGESDGSSSLVPTGPDNPGGKGFDRMCDPTYTGNSLNGNNMSGALPNAPVSGRWFQAQFVQLVQNAFPAFP